MLFPAGLLLAHRPGVENRAGVKVTRANVNRSSSEVDITGRCGGLIIADAVGVAVAELALRTPSPTAHVAVVVQHAGMLGASGDLENQSLRRAAGVAVAAGIAIPGAEVDVASEFGRGFGLEPDPAPG